MNKNTHNSLTPPSPDRIEKEYRSNGEIWYKTPYVNGKKHGLRIGWYDSGKKRKEIYYTRKKRHAQVEWDEVGNVISLTFPTPPIKTTKKHELKN